MKKRVMAAMSGGVDSSVCAALLLKDGYEVCGVTLKLFANEDIGIETTRTCCSLADVEDARSVAVKLGFPHYVFNFRDKFKNTVIDRFVKGYEEGKTPNPCIDCNRFIKFSELLNRATALEQDYIATGHYAKTEFDSVSGRYLLKKPRDLSKDQTYVLYAMTQHELSKTLFPLGNLKKTEVREIANNLGLVNAKKPDSQDICFVKNGDYAAFIEDYTGRQMRSGNFIDKNGNILGVHKGISNYTIGQRKGLGMAFGKPMFVTAKDVITNTVTLGEETELYSNRLQAVDVNLIAVENLTSPVRVTAKTRYRQSEQSAVLHPLDKNRILVEFDSPQRAITEGQSVVFYDGDIVFGGGTIINNEE